MSKGYPNRKIFNANSSQQDKYGLVDEESYSFNVSNTPGIATTSKKSNLIAAGRFRNDRGI